MPQQWLRVNVVYQSPNSRGFINVLYFLPASTVTVNQALANAAAVAAENAVHANMKGVLTTNSQFDGVSVSLHDGNLVFDGTSSAHIGSGSISGDEEPDYVAAVIQKRTDTGGRSGRGRWFLGGVPEGLTDENQLTNAAIADYDAVANDFTNTLVISGVNWSSQMHSAKLNTLLEISGTRTDKYLGRQSRRRVRPIL